MPAPAHETVVFDVHDAKVYALLTDQAGASPTFGAAVDVPGIAEVSLDPNLVSAELKGDGRVIAKKGRIDRYNFSGTYGKLDFDVLQVLIAVSITEVAGSGRTNARSKSPAPLPLFKLEFKIEDLDEGIGDLHVTLWKCQITGGTLLGTSSDNFGQPSFDAEAIALNGTLAVPGTATLVGGDVGVMADWDLYTAVTALTA